MSLYRKFKTDEKVETAGVWLDYGEGTEILVRRAGGSNKAYLQASERFRRKHRRQVELDILSVDAMRKHAIEIYASTIIADWKGVTDEDGNELPFTEENVRKVLTDLPDLLEDIIQSASNSALFRAEIDEADAKN